MFNPNNELPINEKNNIISFNYNDLSIKSLNKSITIYNRLLTSYNNKQLLKIYPNIKILTIKNPIYNNSFRHFIFSINTVIMLFYKNSTDLILVCCYKNKFMDSQGYFRFNYFCRFAIYGLSYDHNTIFSHKININNLLLDKRKLYKYINLNIKNLIIFDINFCIRYNENILDKLSINLYKKFTNLTNIDYNSIFKNRYYSYYFEHNYIGYCKYCNSNIYFSRNYCKYRKSIIKKIILFILL